MPDVQVKLTEFSDLIDSYTNGFVGRQWLAKNVDALLAEPECRFIVLTGRAGVGKTAFMAYLASSHPQWPRYFIRRDSRDLIRPGDGKSFFLTIGGQLATLRPDLFKPEKLKIVVRQRIGEVERNGKAIGVRIEDLRTSPFYSVSILVEQEIRRLSGKSTGVEIGRLITEPRLLTLQDLQILGLLGPAWLLYQNDPQARMVVLVDALDELRFSPTEASILDALCQLPASKNVSQGSEATSSRNKFSEFPPNLRFVITSRPEKFLDRLLGRSDVRKLLLDVTEEDNQKDLQKYIDENLPDNGLVQALSKENKTRQKFITDLLYKAAGNFLYLRSVLFAIGEALVDPKKGERLAGLLRVEKLPNDLDRLYDHFMDSIVDWINKGFGEKAWRIYLRPLLGVLAVARQPLSLSQLMAFTGLDSENLGDLLRELRQFVEPMDGQQAFRIYHTSFAEYLLDAESNVDYPIDGPKWHKTIIKYYFGKILSVQNVDWKKVDDYGLLHLSNHLYVLSANPAYRNQLYEYVGRPVMLTKWQRFNSLESFANDLKTAMRAASQEDPLNWVDFMRCYLIEKSLGSFKLSADVFSFVASAMAQNGQGIKARNFFDQALELSSNIQDNGLKAKTLSAIAMYLSQAGFAEKANEVLDRAISEAQKINNVQNRSQTISAIIQDMARFEDLDSAKEVARQALVHAQSANFSWGKAISMSSIALTLFQIGERGQAREAFSQALNSAWDVEDNEERAYALCAVAAAMEQAGDNDAKNVYQDAVSQFYAMGRPPEDIEDLFSQIYVDYLAESGADFEAAFAMALDIKNKNDKLHALDSVVEALAKAILYGNYPDQLGAKLDIDRLYERATFYRIVSEEAQLPTFSENGLTMRRLCGAIINIEVDK